MNRPNIDERIKINIRNICRNTENSKECEESLTLYLQFQWLEGHQQGIKDLRQYINSRSRINILGFRVFVYKKT